MSAGWVTGSTQSRAAVIGVTASEPKSLSLMEARMGAGEGLPARAPPADDRGSLRTGHHRRGGGGGPRERRPGRNRLRVLYAHDDWERRTENICEEDMEAGNGHAHCMSMLLGSAGEAIPVRAGELGLGTWQRVLFLELDRERERRWVVQVVGT